MRNILITGITGFVGSHLAEYILNTQKDCNIYGLSRWRSSKNNIKNILNKITLIEGDILDLSSLYRCLEEENFDFIFHLAAQSYIKSSFDSPIDTLNTNIIGTANLLEAIKITGQDSIIHICSSFDVYGKVINKDLIDERCALNPLSPYGVSKVGADMLASQYWMTYHMRTIRSRSATHTGPRRSDNFAISSFAKQIVLIEQGKLDKLRVGNLKAIRTFCDVRDIVRAYWLLVNHCQYGDVYNIAGDRMMTIGEALDILKSFSKVKIEHEVDEKLLRPSDVNVQIPNAEKFKIETGWKPEIIFEQTAKDLIDYWRGELCS